MEQKEMSIYEFAKGDIITRIKPLVEHDGYKNFTYIGYKLEFLGILNATIYLRRVKNDVDTNPFLVLFGLTNHIIEIPVEMWKNGWSYYIEPNFLIKEEKKSINDLENMSSDDAIKYLKEAIKIATDKDEFEKAQELQKKLDKLINKE